MPYISESKGKKQHLMKLKGIKLTKSFNDLRRRLTRMTRMPRSLMRGEGLL